jgi:hypothetical protein
LTNQQGFLIWARQQPQKRQEKFCQNSVVSYFFARSFWGVALNEEIIGSEVWAETKTQTGDVTTISSKSEPSLISKQMNDWP